MVFSGGYQRHIQLPNSQQLFYYNNISFPLIRLAIKSTSDITNANQRVNVEVTIRDVIKTIYTGLHEYDISNLVQAGIYHKIATVLKVALSQ